MRHCRTSRIENILLMGIRDKKIPGRVLSKSAGSRDFRGRFSMGH